MLSLSGFGQSVDSTALSRTQGCTFLSYTTPSKSNVCFGDSLIFSSRWTCNTLEPNERPLVSQGVLVRELPKTGQWRNYVFSFPAPGKYTYTFIGIRDTIIVHDPLEQADTLSKDRFCKNDPPFTFSAAYSAYKLGTEPVSLIDPYTMNPGVYHLVQSDNNHSRCRFEISHVITITEACSSSKGPLEMIYPNPAKENMIVPADEGSTIRIIDLYGKVWTELVADPEATRVSLETIPSGVLMVEFSNEGSIRMSKVIHL